jgi:hypothetical protein
MSAPKALADRDRLPSTLPAPLRGDDNPSNQRQVQFFRTDPLPYPALPKIGRVNAEGGRLEVFLDMSPGVPFGPASGPPALRQRLLLDAADLLTYLHAQAPFPMALGRIDAESFKIINRQLRLVQLRIDAPRSKESVDTDVRACMCFRKLRSRLER